MTLLPEPNYEGIDQTQITETLRQGILKWFDPARNYGFIEAEGRQYFTQGNYELRRSTPKELTGRKVEFLGKYSERGWVARGVRLK